MPEFPRVQAVPWSDRKVSFQVEGREVEEIQRQWVAFGYV